MTGYSFRLRFSADLPEFEAAAGGPFQLVLDDPYVDAAHARVGVDGAGVGVIEDLDSINGLVAPDGTRANRLTV